MTKSLFFDRSFKLARLNLRFSRMALALTGAVALASTAHAAEPANWVGAWTASAQPTWDADFGIKTGFPASLWNQTIRQVARISIGGSLVRHIRSLSH